MRQRLAEERQRQALRAWDRRALASIALLLVLAALPTVLWYLTPRERLALLVVDKTVAHTDYREHAGLLWWLDHRRWSTGAGERWQRVRDYLGYDPVTGRADTLDHRSLAGHDLVYITDAYGVYTGDSLTAGPDPGAKTKRSGLERSQLIYGGISIGEAHALADAQRAGAGIVAEFNTIESPTHGTPAADTLAEVLGARYDGWLARWYFDLSSSDEIPRWTRDAYAARTGKRWSFTGQGLVLFGESDGRIVVIPGREFAGPYPVTVDVREPRDPLMRNVESGRPYWYWVSGVRPDAGATVLAEFSLHLSAAAADSVRAQGFPLRTPAVIRRARAPLGVYLAGDFSDVGVAPPPFRQTVGLDWWRRLVVRRRQSIGSMDDTFWHVAAPLWDNLIRETRR